MSWEVIVHVLSKESSKYFYLTAVKRTLPRHLLNLQPFPAVFSLVSFLLSLTVFFTCVLSVSILVLICTKLVGLLLHLLSFFSTFLLLSQSAFVNMLLFSYMDEDRAFQKTNLYLSFKNNLKV